MSTFKALLKTLLLAAALAIPTSAMAIGAIAVDDEVGAQAGYGVSVGFSTESEAKAEALKECRSAGNKSCEVVSTFKMCGAYAASKSYFGVGEGESQKVAEARAIEECGNKACKIVVADCE